MKIKGYIYICYLFLFLLIACEGMGRVTVQTEFRQRIVNLETDNRKLNEEMEEFSKSITIQDAPWTDPAFSKHKTAYRAN